MLRRGFAGLVVAALGGAAEAARRDSIPGALQSALAPEEGDSALRDSCVALSPDIARHVLDHVPRTYSLASADTSGNSVSLWGPHGPTGVLGGHGGAIRGLAFFPSGERALTWGADGVAIVWDMVSRQAIKTLRVRGAVDLARIFPSGDRLLTCGDEGSCVVWDAHSWTSVCMVGQRTRHPLRLFTLADLSPSGAEVLPLGDGVVTLRRGAQASVWDVPRGELRCELLGATVNLAKPYGDRLATGAFEDRRALIWSARTCALLLELPHAHWLVDISVLGGALLAMDILGVVSVWGQDSGALLRTLQAPAVQDAAYDLWPFPDGHRLATVYRQSLVIWNVTSGVALHNISHAGVESVAVAPGGDALAACAGAAVFLWDTRTGSELAPPLRSAGAQGRHRSCFVALAWSAVLGDGFRGPSWRSPEAQ